MVTLITMWVLHTFKQNNFWSCFSSRLLVRTGYDAQGQNKSSIVLESTCKHSRSRLLLSMYKVMRVYMVGNLKIEHTSTSIALERANAVISESIMLLIALG